MAKKNRTMTRRILPCYGEIVSATTIKLIRPLKNGNDVITTPLAKQFYNQHGVGANVMVMILTNQDVVHDPKMAEYTIQDVQFVPSDQTFALVVVNLRDVDTVEAFTDSFKTVLKKYNLVLNVEEANKRFIAWHNGLDSMGDKKGIVVADQSTFPGILTLLEEIQAEMESSGHDDEEGDYVRSQIVDERNAMLQHCGSIVDLYDEDAAKELHVEQVNWLGDYYVPEKVRPIITAITHSLSIGRGYFNLFIGGPSGSGKTEFGKGLARHLDMEFIKVNCHAIADPESWFAERGAKDGSTFINKTRLAKMLDKGSCVILLDEINRIAPDLANPLLPVLDDNRHYELAGELNPIGDGIVFLMTANIGYEYSGTHAIDTAFANRSNATIRFERLPMNIEKQVIASRFDVAEDVADEIMSYMDQIRHITGKVENHVSADLSTRASLNVTLLVKCGLSLFEAFTMAVFNTIPDDEMPKDLIDFIRSSMNPLVEAESVRRF